MRKKIQLKTKKKTLRKPDPLAAITGSLRPYETWPVWDHRVTTEVGGKLVTVTITFMRPISEDEPGVM